MPHDPGRIAERRPGRVLVGPGLRRHPAWAPEPRPKRTVFHRHRTAESARKAFLSRGGRGTDELAPKGIAVVPSAAHEDAASGVVG